MILCKALVVEPDERTRETIDEILTTLDCAYEIADSLAQARKMLQVRADYDLVLSAFDMPSRTGAKPRLQNAEHFMLSLRMARAGNMPKVIMLIEDRPAAGDEDKTRWAFDMRDLGVSDVVRKPLVDEGRTLDRVIKKVMGLDDGNIASSVLPKPIAVPENSGRGPGPLTKMQMDVLESLAESPHQTVLQAEIVAGGGYSKHATHDCLAVLMKLGLVVRPHGHRGGYGVSAEGRRVLASAQCGDAGPEGHE